MTKHINRIFVALETTTSDQEVRLLTAEENIQGTLAKYYKGIHFQFSILIKFLTIFLELQLTDVNHDTRISALEENGGGGGSQNSLSNLL